MSNGFGVSPYGVGQYGIGITSSGPTPGNPVDIIVQAKEDVIGSPVIISGIGIPLVDHSRDDLFLGPTLDPIKWVMVKTGTTTVTLSNGISAKLFKGGTTPSVTITSSSSFLSSDMSMQYDILSNINVSTVAADITFASFEFWADVNNRITVSRKLMAGAYGQQIIVSHYISGVEVGHSAVASTATSGKFRIVKHLNLTTVLHNDVVVYSSRVGFLASGVARMSINSGGQDTLLNVKLLSFTSDTGALFDTAMLLSRTVEAEDKIAGLVPYSTFVGPADVTVFNHNGAIGYKSGAFTYPPLTGATVSSSFSMTGIVQNDTILRDK